MDTIKFLYDHALVPEKEISAQLMHLEPIFEKLKKGRKEPGYNNHESIINVPFDNEILKSVAELVAEKKQLNPKMMVVVGIGGSNLGTQAVYEAIYGKKGNPQFPLYFADTVDSDYIHALLAQVEQCLKASQKILICVISKSGSTTETIANFECFLALLKKYYSNDFHEYVIAITDRDSGLWKLASTHQFARLSIPKKVGGRYSVFTAVGLFPLLFAQINVVELLQGAQIANSGLAATSASIIAYHYVHGKNIHNWFIFDHALETLGKWYRQLMGESLGKDGKGIMPTISIGSTDLHSVGQLYLGGPHDKTTMFVYVDHANHEVNIPKMNEYDQLVSHLQGKSLAAVMKAIIVGTQKAYVESKLPFVTYEIPKKSACYIGQLMQFKIIEMICLGALMDVNPFDQPQVELYKTQTRKILAHE